MVVILYSKQFKAHKVRYLILLSIFIFIFSSLQCKKKKTPKNFLLITLDTQRADYIGSYNPSFDTTPNIDALAENGILFENCISLIPITLPAHAIIFYSLHPHQMHLYNNGQIHEQDEKIPSIAQFFKDQGFTTAAFISLGVLKEKFGLNAGFDVYQGHFPPGEYYLTAEEVNKEALPWLEQIKEENFFLWVHYSDPHSPYYPPDIPFPLELSLNGKVLNQFHLDKRINKIRILLKKGRNQIKYKLLLDHINDIKKNNFAFFDILDFETVSDNKKIPFDLSKGLSLDEEEKFQFLENEGIIEINSPEDSLKITHSFRGKIFWSQENCSNYYQKEVEYMDRQIGYLITKLKELELFEKTKILIVGDHGEGLGEYINFSGNPDFGHVNFLYNKYTNVPLIIHDPKNNRKGKRIKTIASLLDVAPTILGMMGYDPLSHHQGRNLLDLKEDKDYTLLLQTHKPQAERNMFAIVSFPWRLIFIPKQKSFELFNMQDDPEQKNNIYDANKDLNEIKNLRNELMKEAREILKNKKFTDVNKKTKEMLRALGYIK